MHLTAISKFPSFSLFRVAKKHSVPINFDLVSQSFDDILLRGFKTLSPSSISLAWLSKAVDFLALAHFEARNLIFNLKLVSAIDDSLTSYLDDNVKLLDLCNSIVFEIGRFRHHRLLIAFILHLLDERIPCPEKLRRARKSLSDFYHSASGFGKRSNAEVLVRDLALGLRDAPRGKMSSVRKLVRRTVHAVGLVTVFLAGVLVSSMHGSPEMVSVGVPAEFPWEESLASLDAEVSAELKRRFGGRKAKKVACLMEELDDVETRVEEACEVINGLAGEAQDEDKLRLKLKRKKLVEELGKATTLFSNRLERLSDGVNEMFHVVLSHMNHMLENVRVRN